MINTMFNVDLTNIRLTSVKSDYDMYKILYNTKKEKVINYTYLKIKYDIKLDWVLHILRTQLKREMLIYFSGDELYISYNSFYDHTLLWGFFEDNPLYILDVEYEGRVHKRDNPSGEMDILYNEMSRFDDISPKLLIQGIDTSSYGYLSTTVDEMVCRPFTKYYYWKKFRVITFNEQTVYDVHNNLKKLKRMVTNEITLVDLNSGNLPLLDYYLYKH